MISNKEFIEKIEEYDTIEKRGSFYNMAINLINNDFEMEAYYLILSTWNFARFRYAMKKFDIYGFKEKIKELNPYFNKLTNKDIKTINFDNHKNDIKKIFESLSSIKGIEFTGASKVMHLKNSSVFIMWDGYIKGEKPKKYYKELKIVRDGDWKIYKYRNNPENYFQFLQDMQKRFKDIKFNNHDKTFAKAIDEFNYISITLPIQEMEKIKIRNKKGEKK